MSAEITFRQASVALNYTVHLVSQDFNKMAEDVLESANIIRKPDCNGQGLGVLKNKLPHIIRAFKHVYIEIKPEQNCVATAYKASATLDSIENGDHVSRRLPGTFYNEESQNLFFTQNGSEWKIEKINLGNGIDYVEIEENVSTEENSLTPHLLSLISSNLQRQLLLTEEVIEEAENNESHLKFTDKPSSLEERRGSSAKSLREVVAIASRIHHLKLHIFQERGKTVVEYKLKVGINIEGKEIFVSHKGTQTFAFEKVQTIVERQLLEIDEQEKSRIHEPSDSLEEEIARQMLASKTISSEQQGSGYIASTLNLAARIFSLGYFGVS